MSFIFLLSFFMLAAAYSQSPKLYLVAGGGLWQGRMGFEPYSSNYAKRQISTNLSLGAHAEILPKVSLSTEIGFEFFQMRYNYFNVKDPRSIDANLGLFFTRVSPGLVYHPFKGLDLRLAIGVLISSGAIGSYSIYTFVSGQGDLLTGNYQREFSKIRRWGNIGPELNIGYDFVLPGGGMLGPRVSAFIGPNLIFRPDFDTPLNPSVHQVSFEVVYTFSPCMKKNL